ncbi:hypothetical protein Gbfr_018_032 [Gluconobacter frateurii M-2]|nr:hypothetical protein Gbfr_018_032 [Gluconobacter frateurii M-2]
MRPPDAPKQRNTHGKKWIFGPVVQALAQGPARPLNSKVYQTNLAPDVWVDIASRSKTNEGFVATVHRVAYIRKTRILRNLLKWF